MREFAALIVAIMLVGFGTATFFDWIGCKMQTGGMTIPHRYHGMTCQVQSKEAGWINIDNYRVVQ